MNDRTSFTIRLDDCTLQLLLEAAVACGCAPRDLIESIVRDVLVDDAMEHFEGSSLSSHLIH